MTEFSIRGITEAEQLGAALGVAATGVELREGLERSFRAAGRPFEVAVRAGLRAKMPRRGGLAARLGDADVDSTGGAAVEGVAVTLSVSLPGASAEAVDAGEIHHPVFGQTDVDRVAQAVPANVITDAFIAQQPAIEVMAETAVDAVAHTIEVA